MTLSQKKTLELGKIQLKLANYTLVELTRELETENSDVLTHLGYRYETGGLATKEEVIPEPTKAFIYYRIAAEMGNPLAAYYAGLCCSEGFGTVQDAKAAFRYYRKASQQYAPAEVALGECYQYGEGVTIDLTTAYHYYLNAAKNGAYVNHKLEEFKLKHPEIEAQFKEKEAADMREKVLTELEIIKISKDQFENYLMKEYKEGRNKKPLPILINQLIANDIQRIYFELALIRQEIIEDKNVCQRILLTPEERNKIIDEEFYHKLLSTLANPESNLANIIETHNVQMPLLSIRKLYCYIKAFKDIASLLIRTNHATAKDISLEITRAVNQILEDEAKPELAIAKLKAAYHDDYSPLKIALKKANALHMRSRLTFFEGVPNITSVLDKAIPDITPMFTHFTKR